MTDKRILFGDFEFPRTNGLKYLLNEEQLILDGATVQPGGTVEVTLPAPENA